MPTQITTVSATKPDFRSALWAICVAPRNSKPAAGCSASRLPLTKHPPQRKTTVPLPATHRQVATRLPPARQRSHGVHRNLHPRCTSACTAIQSPCPLIRIGTIPPVEQFSTNGFLVTGRGLASPNSFTRPQPRPLTQKAHLYS